MMECKSMPFLYSIAVLHLELYPASKTALILLLRDPADLSLSLHFLNNVRLFLIFYFLRKTIGRSKAVRQNQERSDPICKFSTVIRGQGRVINLSTLWSSSDLDFVPYNHIN